jgi:hypothetical protein
MKFIIALLFCIVAAASAQANWDSGSRSYGYGHKDYGFDKPQNL